MTKLVLQSLSLFSLLIFTICPSSWAQVTPPNYDFSFDRLQVFWPDQNLEQMVQEHGDYEMMHEVGNHRLLRFSVEHLRYKFGAFVELRGDRVIGFFAALPSYFLHDIFHQGLINRFGMQDEFFHRDATSVYRWNNANGLTLTYSGACTITCFPIYVSGTGDETLLLKSFLGDLRPTTPAL